METTSRAVQGLFKGRFEGCVTFDGVDGRFAEGSEGFAEAANAHGRLAAPRHRNRLDVVLVTEEKEKRAVVSGSRPRPRAERKTTPTLA